MPEPDTGPTIVRLAFLGAWQVRRVCSWKDAVMPRTPHVLPSRARRHGARRVKKLLDEGAGPIDVRIVGYSWGAWTALQLIERLAAAPARFHPRLEADPWTVRLGLLDPVGVFRRVPRLPDDPRVQCWSVYQRNGCYEGCPGRSNWYRGEPIDGADNRDLTQEGREHPPRDGVPPEHAPDHIQLGYRGWNDWDQRIASVLDGDAPW